MPLLSWDDNPKTHKSASTIIEGRIRKNVHFFLYFVLGFLLGGCKMDMEVCLM
jgi:VanZ family protein